METVVRQLAQDSACNRTIATSLPPSRATDRDGFSENPASWKQFPEVKIRPEFHVPMDRATNVLGHLCGTVLAVKGPTDLKAGDRIRIENMDASGWGVVNRIN